MEYNAAIFRDEVEELIHQLPYTMVDILPFVEKYTDNADPNDIGSIRMKMLVILEGLKNAGFIEGQYYARLSWQPPLMKAYQEEPIFIRSTFKFEEYYSKKHTPPVQPIMMVTHGHNSPIAGRDVRMENTVNNEDKDEKNGLNKKSYRVNVILLIVAILTLIIGYLALKK
jgi:hypothetical protein